MTPPTAVSAPTSERTPIFSPSTIRVMGSKSTGVSAMMALTTAALVVASAPVSYTHLTLPTILRV